MQASPLPSDVPGCSKNVIEVGEHSSGQDILQSHAAKMVDDLSEYSLFVDRTSRESLWLAVVAFYKNNKLRPNKMSKRLVVSFQGEVGADAGFL